MEPELLKTSPGPLTLSEPDLITVMKAMTSATIATSNSIKRIGYLINTESYQGVSLAMKRAMDEAATFYEAQGCEIVRINAEKSLGQSFLSDHIFNSLHCYLNPRVPENQKMILERGDPVDNLTLILDSLFSAPSFVTKALTWLQGRFGETRLAELMKICDLMDVFE